MALEPSTFNSSTTSRTVVIWQGTKYVSDLLTHWCNIAFNSCRITWPNEAIYHWIPVGSYDSVRKFLWMHFRSYDLLKKIIFEIILNDIKKCFCMYEGVHRDMRLLIHCVNGSYWLWVVFVWIWDGVGCYSLCLWTLRLCCKYYSSKDADGIVGVTLFQLFTYLKQSGFFSLALVLTHCKERHLLVVSCGRFCCRWVTFSVLVLSCAAAGGFLSPGLELVVSLVCISCQLVIAFALVCLALLLYHPPIISLGPPPPPTPSPVAVPFPQYTLQPLPSWYPYITPHPPLHHHPNIS